MDFIVKLLSNSIATFFLGTVAGYFLEKIFDLIGGRLKGIPKKINDKKMTRYSEVIKSDDFIDFQKGILKKYYGEEVFTTVFGEEYPVFCIKGNVKYPFTQLCENGFSRDKNLPFKNKFYKKYKTVVGQNIYRPKMQGFMLDNFILNDSKEITGMNTWVGTYEENVYTSHVLEYELYNYYIKYKKGNKLDIQQLELRNKIHNGIDKKLGLYKGENRASLLGVQLLIVCKDFKTHRYQVLTIKRSEDVAAKPGFYQFVPSGGFEVYENSDEHDDHELKENYNVLWAVYREYLEELIMGKENEYEYGQGGETIAKLEREEAIQEITNYIDNKEARFEFLGSVTDLCGLRNELSFVLRIDNIKYSKKNFKSNSESKKIERFYIDEIEIDPKKINPPSAALWHLFIESDVYKEIAHSE